MDKIELVIWTYRLDDGYAGFTFYAFDSYIPDSIVRVRDKTRNVYVMHLHDFQCLSKKTNDKCKLARLVHDWCEEREKNKEYNRFVDELLTKHSVYS